MATPLDMFNYSSTVTKSRQSNTQLQKEPVHIRWEVDEDTPYHPEHSAPQPIFRCYSRQENEWKKVMRYSLWKCNLAENDNPPWIASGDEYFMENCDDIVDWSRRMREYQDSKQWPADIEQLIQRNKQVRNLCVDTMQFRFALIILDVYIEDVLFDTGSMYNAMSSKAFYDLSGRFKSFTRAYSAANWDPQMKHVNVVGGGRIPVIATVELEVQTSTGKTVPIVWAIYDDVDYIVILGTDGMRRLGFQCKSPELGNHDLFKSKQKSEQIAAKFYEPAMAPWRPQDSDAWSSPCLEPKKVNEHCTPSTSREDEDEDDEDIEEMLTSNAAAIQLLADAQNLSPFVTPEERSSLMGGMLLQTALEDAVEPLIQLESVDEEEFRPENIPDGEIENARENALVRAVNSNLASRDFPYVSTEPKPPNFFE